MNERTQLRNRQGQSRDTYLPPLGNIGNSAGRGRHMLIPHWATSYMTATAIVAGGLEPLISEEPETEVPMDLVSSNAPETEIDMSDELEPVDTSVTNLGGLELPAETEASEVSATSVASLSATSVVSTTIVETEELAPQSLDHSSAR